MKIKQGEKIIYKYIISNKDIDDFAVSSGDIQIIHTNNDKNTKTIFGSKIAHGLLTIRPVSYILGILVPDNNEYILIKEMNVKFLKPVYPNNKIVLTLFLEKELGNNNWIVGVEWVSDKELVADGKIIIKVLNYKGR